MRSCQTVTIAGILAAGSGQHRSRPVLVERLTITGVARPSTHPHWPFAEPLSACPMRRLIFSIPLIAAISAPIAAQQSGALRYPVKPSLLPEAEEISLARSAAPAEVSGRADIYVLRATGLERVVSGTNGCACFVARDLHEGSRYPICYDQEAVRTSMPKEVMELKLRMSGRTENEIKELVADAYKSGARKTPTKPSLIYMMSPRQVLFSSPGPEGVRVGAWRAHLMIPMPFATTAQFGLLQKSKVDGISIDNEDQVSAQLIVVAPNWADSAGVRKHP